MAEIKNTFLSSKMNKDLDDRLIPNGEYIDALNIQVGRSESNDVGALQAILGNSKELISLETNDNLVCIGTFMDNQNNCIYQFLTSYKDPNPAANTLPVGSSREMKITEYNLDLGTYKTLVSGNFLNFAYNKECLILGVNLIEGLLYWTDNRNQPRKINIQTARSIPGYYTAEEHISVAKYAPVDPIFMYKKVSTKVTVASSFPLGSTFDVEDPTGIEFGMTLNYSGATLNDANIVTEINGNTITCYLAVNPGLDVGDEITFLSSTMTNESDDPSWPGDPDFIEAKYIRFSYRFRFDDNEYSIMAPFTQIAYIPKQKGYFIKGNEEDAYKSTVINWMENNVNNIELMIPLPDVANKISSSYKIKEIDVLYKESDSAVVKVLETIEATALQSNSTNNIYIQQYQSQNPYKTLPEAQLVRVYDKVPVRALAQDITGNRLIYGNFYDRYTAPTSINYNIGVFKKSVGFTNYVEYPNHTLKQNRNYQVGIILSDKFGRSSSVILSSIDKNGIDLSGSFFGGSSIYSPYIKEGAVDFSVKSWMGNALFMVVNDPITSSRNIPSGTPGLYAVQIGNGFEINPSVPVVITNTSISFETVSGPSPLVGQYLRGQYKDYVKITKIVPLSDPPIYNTDGRASDLYLENIDNPPDTKYAYTINPIGWYSYKVVVRQQEHDYYNVYLPGILDGYPNAQTFGSQVTYNGSGFATLENAIDFTVFPQSETGNTAHAVLINDNINKVPRDLAEVGPDQKQYRSSVELYGRVSNGSVEIIGPDGDGIKSDPPPGYDQRTNNFSYDPDDPIYGEDWLSVAAGDGIQSVEANTPTPGSPPIPNTDAWYANTVVVKNDKANKKIYFTPLNIIRGANNGPIYEHYIITKAENLQYYPSRKADVVSSIATSKEFNFVENSVTNVKGTAGLNFYQMQSDPLIGRIATVSNIGVTSEKGMVPFLAVYETNPTESLLDIFWETSTTGLISDLNWDVLTGFDGPVALTDDEFQFWEDQNPNGLDAGTGDPESPYITEPFFPVSNLGIQLNDTEATLKVEDLTGEVKTELFKLVQNQIPLDPQFGSYRIRIDPASVFVFGPKSYIEDNFVFTLTITRGTSIVSLQLTGRLGNRMPYLTPDEACINGHYNKNISQDIQDAILTITARNGCFSNGPVKDDFLRFEIISQNPTSSPNYFSINPASGALTLDDPFVPIGSYELEIKVTDAVDFATNPPMGDDTTDVLTKFSSMSQTCIIVITVNNRPVNTWLQPGYNLEMCGPYECGNYPVLQQPCRDTQTYGFSNWQPENGRVFAIDPMHPFDYTYSTIEIYIGGSGTPLASNQYGPVSSGGMIVGINIFNSTTIPVGAFIMIFITPGPLVKVTDKYGLWVVAKEPLLNRVDLFPTGGDPAPAELDPNADANAAFFAQLPAVPLMSNPYGPPPDPIDETKAYNTFDNIEAKNGLNYDGSGNAFVVPSGLQQGTLRWTVRLFISSYLNDPAGEYCQELATKIIGYTRIIIFRRLANLNPAIPANPNPWKIVTDNNNVIGTGSESNNISTSNKGDFTSGLRSNVPSNNPNDANNDKSLGARLDFICGGESRGYREVTFTTENPDEQTYEWAVAVWYKDASEFKQVTSLPVDDCNCTLIDYLERMYVTVGVEDANYTYPDWEPGDDNTQGVTTAHKYYTGLDYGLSLPKTTYAIPFTTQDANMVDYESALNTVFSVSNIAPLSGEVITIKLTIDDTQIAPGITVKNVNTGGSFGTVSGAYFIDPTDNRITVPVEYTGFGLSPQPGNPIKFSFKMDAVLVDPNPCPIPTPIPEPTFSIIYATTPEGSEVEQFYEDELLTTPWNPTGDPDAPNAFYNFTQWDTQYFNTEVCNSIGLPVPLQVFQASRPQMFPWWSAKMTASGKVIKQPPGTPPDDHYTVQTSLKFANTAGTGFTDPGLLLGRNLKERRYGPPAPGNWIPCTSPGPPPPIP